MEPEIARRCHDCGASVRSGSLFCPQCGKALNQGAAGASAPNAETSDNRARRATDPGRSAAIIDPVESAPASSTVTAQESPAAVAASGESRRHAEAVDTRAGNSGDGGEEVLGGGGGAKRQGVTASARDVVEEKLAPRVEKLRHASNVMLEEAAYDPSLRFVLVAVIILVLSLFLLLLNYLIG